MKITLRNVVLLVSLGVYEWEKETKRNIILNIITGYDAQKAAKSDDIADALDYSEIERAIVAIAAKKHFHLLEHLLDEMAKMLLDTFPKLEFIEIEAVKPGALKLAESVSVTHRISRKP